MNYKLHSLIRFAPDNEQGSGSESGESISDDIVAKLQGLIDKRGGDAGAVALKLYQDNYQLRERNRQLREQLPPEGAVVLTGDDAKAWQAYQALGTPEALQQAVQERAQAQGDLNKLRRDAMLREAAEAANFKHSVLAGLDAQAGGALAYEVREVEQDGKKAKVAYVKAGEAEAVPLTQYAQQQWADFMPALQVQPPQPSGTPYPPQQNGGKPVEVDLVAQFQKEQDDARKAVKNPLLRE